MGKDSKPKDAGAKGMGKGKQAVGGSDENASKGKGKSGKAERWARHLHLCQRHGYHIILCEGRKK